MWTAKIAEKVFKGGYLEVIVEYSNGVDAFTERLRLQVGSQLNDLVDTRLRQLTETDTFASSLAIGTFTPLIVKEEPQPMVKSAIAQLSALKQAVDLGVITTDAPEYQEALSSAKTEFTNTAIASSEITST